MDYLAKEQKVSGLTAEQLQAVGCTEPGFKELSMIRVAKYLTNMTKHPGGLPYAFGMLCSRFMGFYAKEDWKALKKSRTKKKVKLENGRSLKLTFVECPEKYRKEDGKERIIVLSHGFNSVSTYMLQYYSIYMKEGFSAVYFDQRGHGKAKKYECTMGYNEALDLIDIVKALRKKHGRNAIIGVQGESMGSGTLAQALDGIDETSDFAVLDCGYSGMDEMACWIEKLFFFYPKAALHDLVNELSSVGDVKYTDVKGLTHIKAARPNYPVFFAHGGGDFFVPTHFSKDMAKAKRGKAELHIYGHAFHAQSRFLHHKDYEKDIHDWMEKNYLL